MKNRNCTIAALALLAPGLSAIQSLAQSTYEPYTFTTLAGGGGYSTNAVGRAARPWLPQTVAVGSSGNVYVADFYFNTIRKGFPAPMILNAGFMLGQFNFNLTGPTGRSVVVEASSDLASWLPLWTNTFAGILNFSDPASGVSSNRFYRAHTP
jgi:hypothetical protein